MRNDVAQDAMDVRTERLANQAVASSTLAFQQGRTIVQEDVPATSGSVSAHYVTTQSEAALSAEFSLGSLASGVLKHSVAAGVSTPATATEGTDYYKPGGTKVAVADGGTNLASYAVGDIPYASAATTIAKLADVATGNALISGGIGTAPSYGKIGLTTHVSGVLPVANGGVDPSAWASWTPTWTNLTVGNGTVVAKYIQIGKTTICRLSIVFGTTTTVGGDIQFSFPVTSVTYEGTANTQELGGASVFDVDGSVYGAAILWTTTTAAKIRVFDSSGTYLTRAVTSATIPFTWATSDEIAGEFFYEAA